MSRYKNKWRDNGSKNKKYWKEVLVGRTIKKLKFDDLGCCAFILDSGERIYFPGTKVRFAVDD